MNGLFSLPTRYLNAGVLSVCLVEKYFSDALIALTQSKNVVEQQMTSCNIA